MKRIIKVAVIDESNFRRVLGEYLVAHGMDERKVELSPKWGDADYAHIWEIDRWDPLLIEGVEKLGARSGGYVREVDGPFYIEWLEHGGERIVYRDRTRWSDPWSDGSPSVSEEVSDSEHERRSLNGDFDS